MFPLSRYANIRTERNRRKSIQQINGIQSVVNEVGATPYLSSFVLIIWHTTKPRKGYQFNRLKFTPVPICEYENSQGASFNGDIGTWAKRKQRRMRLKSDRAKICGEGALCHNVMMDAA